ncbi:MAG: tetratricopeptide repeat protein [Elusimicrobiales bacterium]
MGKKRRLEMETRQQALSARESRLKWLLLAVPLAVSLAVYSSSFGNTLLYGDDENIILRNRYLDGWQYLPDVFRGSLMSGSGAPCNFYRPLQTVLYMLITQLFGRGPVWPYHLANTVLHGLAGALLAVMLFMLIKRAAEGGSCAAGAARAAGAEFPGWHVWLALAGALVWTVHPIHVEEVAQPTGTQSPMHGFFMLGVFVCLLRALRARKAQGGYGPWLLLMNAALAFGLLSKESAAAAAPVALLLHLAWCRLGGEKPGDLAKIHAPLWIITGVYVALRLTVLNFGGTLDFYSRGNIFTENFSYRFYTLLAALGEGVRVFFWPSGLHPERSWPVFTDMSAPGVWVSALLLSACGIWAALRWRRGAALPGLGLGFFLIAYMPMSNLAAKINYLFCEHWFYIPSAGLALLVCAIAARSRSASGLTAALLVLAVPLAAAAYARNPNWHDPETYCRFVLKWEPRSAKTWNNLAMALDARGDQPGAADAYNRAISISDEYPHTHYNLAQLYRRQGRVKEAVAEYEKALAMSPGFYYAHMPLAEIYFSAGQPGKTLEHLLKVKEIYPLYPDIDAVIARARAQVR